MTRHHVHVTLLGERIDTRGLESLERLVEAPVVEIALFLYELSSAS